MSDNLNLPQVSESQNGKEVTINDAIDQLSGAVDDFLAVATGDADYTLTLTDFQQYMSFSVSGNTVVRAFNLPTGSTKRAIFMVQNTDTSAVNVVLGTTTFQVAGYIAPATNKPPTALFQTDGTANGLFLLTPAAGAGPSGEIDIAPDFVGQPRPNQTYYYPFNRAASLPLNLAGTQIFIGTAATSDTTFTLQKNGSSIGTIVFHSGSGPTISVTATSFAISDVLSLSAPNSPDATLADVTVNFNCSLT